MADRTPKVPAKPPATRRTLSHQLREVIEDRGLGPSAIAELTGIDRAVVSRFMRGTRDIQLGTADRIAAALGLRLVEVARPSRRSRP